jgi:hypothetical protein
MLWLRILVCDVGFCDSQGTVGYLIAFFMRTRLNGASWRSLEVVLLVPSTAD